MNTKKNDKLTNKHTDLYLAGYSPKAFSKDTSLFLFRPAGSSFYLQCHKINETLLHHKVTPTNLLSILKGFYPVSVNLAPVLPVCCCLICVLSQCHLSTSQQVIVLVLTAELFPLHHFIHWQIFTSACSLHVIAEIVCSAHMKKISIIK